ncbi:MAG TPA: maleylpyruvate isomerase N-terminal domain-containing protein [Acidobacteriaceae bacterium]|nr:maleylpyruvate isomerase N-terminal domain-containing protein [Acidobacteriaceae bacterium]
MPSELCGTQPVLCAALLRQVDQRLIDLLRSLSLAEWELPTIAPQWRVRDVAAHLLDTALRKLSLARDQWRVEKADIRCYQDVIDLVNRLNREGVAVYRRLSPAVLIELMQLACRQSAEYHESLDPFAPAAFGVSWAGEVTSPVWFDTARELTERWHHQEQIRLATNRPGIMIRSLYHPVLDTFLRGLPYAFHDVAAPSGTAVLVEVSGECGGQWCLLRSPAGWAFAGEMPGEISARIVIPESIAWRIFTKGIDCGAAGGMVAISGDRVLAANVLALVAIVG